MTRLKSNFLLQIFCVISLFTGTVYGAAFQFGGLRLDALRVTSSGSATALTKADKQVRVVTGSSSDTQKLPDATGLSVGYWYEFLNESSGTLTVSNSSSTAITTLSNGQSARFYVTSTATSGGNWAVFKGASTSGGSGAGTLVYSKTSSGSETWNPGASVCGLVKFAGGGGGGGGGGNGSNGSEAGEGGGGSACQAVVCLTAQNYTVNVGAGGAGGAAAGAAAGNSGSDGSATTLSDAGATVVLQCPGGLGGDAGTSDTTKWWRNHGGYGGRPTCNVNTGAAGADGTDGGYSPYGLYADPGDKGTGTGDSGGTCGGGGGGAGLGAGGNAGGGYSCGAASNGSSGGGGGGGGSSGHPSVCNGTAGGTGGTGAFYFYQF